MQQFRPLSVLAHLKHARRRVSLDAQTQTGSNRSAEVSVMLGEFGRRVGLKLIRTLKLMYHDLSYKFLAVDCLYFEKCVRII
ncbi:MAG: hypothetical protein EBU22_06395 [Actinobacteria bacterium]|nr:hypothetical protein [Actinomycetota bacterium]